MSMPPSGVEGLMDEQSLIEAEIQLELENINLDDNVQLDDELNGDVEIQQDIEEQDVEVADELDGYIKRLQEQSNRFEQELLECDELLTHSSTKNESTSTALIPFEDQTLLMQLAKEQGCDVEEYRRKILEDIENDDLILEDDLADLIDETSVGSGRDREQCSITENGETGLAVSLDARLPVNIEKAVEEGIDYDEVPVSQALVSANGEGDGQINMRRDMQKMLKEQLNSVEHRYQERIEKIKKDEAYRRDEEQVRDKRMTEERQWKLQEIQRQEHQLVVEREMAEREIQREQEIAEKEMQENMRKFQEEMSQLQADMERQKNEHEVMVEMERQKQEDKQLKAVSVIQRTYRGYRVRKETQPILVDRREERKKEKEEQRIKELEIEIDRRKEEQCQQKELERQKQDEEKRQKEEQKRQKEEERKRLEEEKKRKKEEEERIKQEEKKRKEEEKQRKKEEEKKKKEEEKRKKEEEEQRKREEKKLKEEEEKKRKEEEKRRKEEEKRLKEEEKKREKERQLEEDRKKKEEISLKEENKNKENIEKSEQVESGVNVAHMNDSAAVNIEQKSECNGIGMVPEDSLNHTDVENENGIKDLGSSTGKSGCKTDGDDRSVTEKMDIKGEILSGSTKAGPETVLNNTGDNTEGKGHRPKTPRSARTVRTPRPPTPRKDSKNLKKMEEKKEINEEKMEIKADILPDHLESLRLKFIKECQPWSKVSNEPWKLKAGVSRKPLRRPSSAKKMPLLSEDVVIQAARVASLKMVTTVELKDLPGSNMSTLGQCGGLRYLTLNNCNLVAIEGLGQCKQLQYINVQDNKIEYVDLKDVGQLQYLNLSHNKLSSIHGLDNCTNLRWLDISHNNVTRLGGMDTMRRIHTLKLSHNQLISTQGLGATPTLQMLDVSCNHLQAVEDLDKLCLLFSLNASSNNLLQVPSLHNQVLLIELLLSDNSISSLSVLAAVWLPLLSTVQLDQNSISDLPSLQNCLVLKELLLSDNQITDPGTVQHCVEACFYLEQLQLQENPVHTDLNDSFYTTLKCSCPRLTCGPDVNNDTAVKLTPVKPRNSFETMCLTQIRAMKDAIGQFEHNIKLSKNGPHDQSQFCDVHYKFCDRMFNIAVEYRYAHEYGDISVAMPTAPTGPKSGRPLSSRQREKFMNPKEMFENALKSSKTEPDSVNVATEKEIVNNDPKNLFENALKSQATGNKGAESLKNNYKVLESKSFDAQPSHAANPRDLFEQALKSADKPTHGTAMDTISGKDHLRNGHILATQSKAERGLHAPHKMSQAATVIQAFWRSYWCRKQLMEQLQKESMSQIDPALLEKMNKSAVIIQASWKGYILRKKLLAALEYAQCNFSDEEDEDVMDFGDEFDLDKFVDIDQDLLDTDWKPPDTPDIPSNYAVLKKPPSGKPRVPPINTADLRPPSNPRRAWRNAESPLSDMGKIPRPPSSVASTELTMRSGVSKKEEKLAEEWGFKDTNTAHLMMQRAKKMKYNAERRKKISKLDPKQRLALFRKLEEVIHPPTHTVPQRKTLPRKEYFQARQDEIVRQDQEKRQEYHNKASRTFEWLHTQVGEHQVSDSVINQGHTDGPKYMHAMENLPELLNGGKRVQLVSSPMSVELQSVESASTTGQKPRRFSAGSGSSTSKLPPIQPASAPAPAPHLKERMSFRNPKVNESVGWGGGKKRGNQF